jgi:hypothetical protein
MDDRPLLGVMEAMRLQQFQVALAAAKSMKAAQSVAGNPANAVHEYLMLERRAAFERSSLSRVCFDWREIDPMGHHFPDLHEYGLLTMPDEAIDDRTGRPYGFRHPTSGLRSPTVVFVFAGTDDRGDRIAVEVRMLDPFGVPTDEAIDVARRWALDSIELGNRIVSGTTPPATRFPEPTGPISPKAAAVREILLASHPVGLQGPELFERMRERSLPIDEEALKRIKKELAGKGCPIGNERGVGYFLVPLP